MSGVLIGRDGFKNGVKISLAGLLYLSCMGCKMAYSSWDWNKELLIEKSDDIVVATATSSKKTGNEPLPFSTTFTFKVEETIKGTTAPTEFQIPGIIPRYPDHEKKRQKKPGRASYDTSCDLSVSFFEGTKYIIFLKDGKPVENKFSFEVFNGVKDSWYKRIKSHLLKVKPK